MADEFLIATDNFTLDNGDGVSINISVGNQFILIEALENNFLKLKPLDLEIDQEEIVLPKSVVENMSQAVPRKPNPIFRSQSAIKERICSLNLNDNDSNVRETCNFSSFGHGISVHESMRFMSKSSYDTDKKRAATMINKPNIEIEETVVDSPADNENNWIKSKEDGTDVFINSRTKQRWRITKDDSGRPYYYDEDSRKSSWKLPDQNELEEDAVKPIDEVLESVSEAVERVSESSEHSDDSFESDSSKTGAKDEKEIVKVDESPEVFESAKEGNKKYGIRHIKKEHISGPLFNKLMRTERSGQVEKAKVSENGKEIPVKWMKFHLILTGPELFFYKDAKAAIPKSGMPHGKVELKLKIQNLQFSEKKDNNSNGTIMQMEDTGAPGSNITYLLKFSISEEMKNWLVALQFAKDWKQEDLYSDKASTVIITSDKKLLDTACIDDSSGDKQNIKLLLKQFLKIRPSPETLEARGILKPEAVFGSSLEILCEQEKNKVPEFVYRCILAIEARGLHHSGIYRVSGNQAKIQKLRLAVDENKYQLNSESMELETLTGAFKLFFKELKKPLLDEDLCSKMIDLLSNRKVDKKNTYKDVNINTAKKLISKMKQPYYETAKALFGHLKKVAANSSKNLMDVGNISMVWGPNLYSSTGQASTKMAVLLMTHNQIIDFLISRYSDLFDVSSK